MTRSTVKLPKNKVALAQLLRRHASRCEMAFMYRRTNWLMAWYYMNGYRRFDVFDPTNGRLTPHLLDADGSMEFQSQQLLYDINQVAGRLQAMDLRCRTLPSGFTLEGQRSASLAQITCDSIFSPEQVRSVAEQWSYLFTTLGFVGLQAHVEDHPTIGLTSDIEVIHPKELFPFPVTGQDSTKAQGLMRQRYVPLSELQERYGSKIRANEDSMEWFQTDPGEAWAETPDSLVSFLGGTAAVAAAGGNAIMDMAKGGKDSRDMMGVARTLQLWLFGPRGTVTRYIETSGDYVLADVSLEDVEVYCPIGVSRFMNNGSWYGAGMFDLMFSQHRMLERLTKSLYTNIMDIDRYGVLVLPQGQYNQNNLLKDVGRGLRVMFWDPDPVSQGFNPFPIQPFNSGETPGRVAQFAREGLASINPIQDLIKEKGRVDSASGLQFLDEQITRALTTPTLGVQSAWSTMYRSGCQQALSKMASSKRALPVGSLSLDLAGAVIDSEKGTVSFDENPLPEISRVSFTVRDLSPKSKVARKQEALDLWARGINQDPLNLRMLALEEDLDLALWQMDDKNSYEMAIRTILILFNNGKEPGRIVLTPHTTRPEMLMRLVAAFMSGPIMMSASPEVVDAFKQLRELLMSYAGPVLPEGVPNPDDMAILSQQSQQAPPGV